MVLRTRLPRRVPTSQRGRGDGGSRDFASSSFPLSNSNDATFESKSLSLDPLQLRASVRSPLWKPPICYANAAPPKQVNVNASNAVMLFRYVIVISVLLDLFCSFNSFIATQRVLMTFSVFLLHTSLSAD